MSDSSQGVTSPSTTVLEVYEYPSDCVASELSYHFSKPPYHAQSNTPLHAMWNYRSASFVIEFPAADALRIVQDPVQLLDETDPSSQIRLSLLDTRRCAQVLVSSEHELSHRMIKQFFGQFGPLESCQPSGGAGVFGVILTFKDRPDAERVCQTPTHAIGPALTVRTQMFSKALVDIQPPSPTTTAYTLNFDLDSASYVDIDGGSIEKKEVQGAVSCSPTLNDDDSYVAFDSSINEKNVSHEIQPTQPRRVSESEESHLYESVNPIEPAVEDLENKQDKGESYLKMISHLPIVQLHSCIQVNNTIIRLIYGDISEHRADVLVHSGGQAKLALASKCYLSADKLQDLETLTAHNSGSIVITTAPNLPARYIFGIRFGRQISMRNTDVIRQCIQLCLRHCSTLKVASIAFPALGTANHKQDNKEGKPECIVIFLFTSIVKVI
ncbi:uncharacterized protein [Watersipora subatra]|uniref:uncharacterized protein isoform X2 n=1 Tax=Watersipora subatra TaxID=2589382 RepID=UPI00355C16CA